MDTNIFILEINNREVRIFNNNITRGIITNIITFNFPLIIFFNKNLFYIGALLKRIITSNPTNISSRYNNITIYIILGIRKLVSVGIIGRTGVPGLSIKIIRSYNY